MDALFVNLFVIILILILYPRQHSTILYVIKRNERRSAHPEERYPMDRKLDDFLFYFPRIVMALIGAAAFAFGAWFSQFYYLYLNCIVSHLERLPRHCFHGNQMTGFGNYISAIIYDAVEVLKDNS